MKRITVMVLTLAFAGLSAVAASAHPNSSNLDPREVWQQQRIHAGQRNGQLTRREMKRLRAAQRHIQRMEIRGRADGRLDPRERACIQKALDRQNTRIRRMRQNGYTI